MHHGLHYTLVRLARLLIAVSLLLSLSLTATAAAPVSMLAGQPELVKDIQNMNGWSAPSRYVPVGDAFYFNATNDTYEIDWWRSEGTAETTTMVEELVPGPEGTNPIILTALDATRFLLFTSLENDSPPYPMKYYLWISDGTAAGTTQLGQFEGSYSNLNTSAEIVRLDGVLYLYFAEMFLRTDGTAAGTARVMEMPLTEQRLVAFNGWLYFATQGPSGKELYRTNPAAPAPVLVKDICPDGVNCGNEPGDANPIGFAAGTDKLYFVASSPEHGRAIWSTTGAGQPVTLVADFSTDLNGPDSYGILTPVGSGLYFVGRDGVTGSELWHTLGTPQSTHQVADLAPGASEGGILEMIVQGNTLFLTAQPAFTGPYNIYKTNGSGVEKLSTTFTYASGLTPVGNEIFFTTSTPPSIKSELWKITESGDLARLTSYYPFLFMSSRAVWKGNLLFTAGDPIHGQEPWISDGTVEGTRMLADIRNGETYDGVSSQTRQLLYQGKLYFGAARGFEGTGLWSTDGTGEGTQQVAQFNSSSYWDWKNASDVVEAHGLLYFSALDSQGYTGGLWRSNGTEQGTVRISDQQPYFYPNAGEQLFFCAHNEAGTAYGLWSLNKGQSSPTMFFKTCPLFHIGAFGSQAIFVDWDTTLGTWELWQTDGTSAGTQRIYGPAAAPTSWPMYPVNYFEQMVDFDGRLFFLAPLSDGDYSLGLFAWDGETVTQVTAAAGEPRYPSNLVVVGNSLYFGGMNGTDSVLWRLPKGANVAQVVYTAATNLMSYDLNRVPTPLADFNGKLVFRPHEQEGSSRILWLSDGTASGTVPICPECGYTARAFQTVVVEHGRVYFAAHDPQRGAELWVSDGTSAGTQLAAEIVPGPSGSYPARLMKLGNRLLFIADDGEHGEELWRYNLPLLDKPIYLPLIKR